jgi:hypothetical protein
MLWGHCCIIRIAVVYRGRAVLLVWKVLAHASSAVAFDAYKELLDQTAQLLLPFPCQVVFLADRGFADIELMNHLTQLGWQWRIRLKGNFLIYRGDHRRCKAQRITPAAGRAILWQWVQHGLSKGWALITRLHLPGTPDPEPVRASRKQFANKAIPVFQFIVADLASVVCS